MTRKRKLKLIEDMDFDIQKYSLNRYELDDGTILRVMHIPVKIFKSDKFDQRGTPIYIIQSQIIVSAIVPQELKGRPDPPLTQNEFNELDLEPIDFRILNEPWNEYNLADGTVVRLRVIINQISKSERKNQFGEPIYFVSDTRSIDTRVPKYLRRKK